jgi:hypothetical protein
MAALQAEQRRESKRHSSIEDVCRTTRTVHRITCGWVLQLGHDVRSTPFITPAFSVSTQFTVLTGKKSGRQKGMPLVTRIAALKAGRKRAGVGTNGTLECKFLSEKKNPHL